MQNSARQRAENGENGVSPAPAPTVHPVCAEMGKIKGPDGKGDALAVLAVLIFLLMIIIALWDVPMNFFSLISSIAAMVLWKWMEEESDDYSDGYLYVCRFFCVVHLLNLLYHIGYIV